MPIKTKRWNDPVEPDDGFRLLICRYRPRGVSKQEETWDAWWPDLGPSRELHAAFWDKQGTPISWAEYRRRYLAEMKLQTDRLRQLVERLRRGETITLLCSSACLKEQRCHRWLLRQLLEKMLAGKNSGRLANGRHFSTHSTNAAPAPLFHSLPAGRDLLFQRLLASAPVKPTGF